MPAPNIRCLLFLILLAGSKNSTCQVLHPAAIYSPDHSTVMETGADAQGMLAYRMLYAGQEVISWSRLGFVMSKMEAGTHTVVKKIVQRSRNETFAWPLGENKTIVNQYNEAALWCRSAALQYKLVARVYNGSIAFRYEAPLPLSQHNSITKESTTFNFPGPYTIYQYNQESVFTPMAIDTFTRTSDFPATLTDGKLFVSIGEADNESYTKAELKRGGQPHSLSVALTRDTAVQISGLFTSPWRTVSVSKTASGLHHCSDLFLKLAPPAVKPVPAWIKPGKLIRAQLNTRSGLDCIDFAAKHNFQYIMFDAGWYGAEVRSGSDPAQVIPQIDMPRVIQHGKNNGIGVILYVNYIGLKAKLDTLLPLYKQWGVKGLKFGFVDGLTHSGLTWLAAAIKKVNDYGFILDIHDNYKPTGLSRTYPALLTQEGVRGDENSPDAFHNTVLPFTRFLAGPADFTFCFPNARNSYSKNIRVSKAQQLALTVIYFSPLQSIFWYGNPNDYTNEAEIEFFTYVPTVWDETHYLAGEIGRNITVARRKGNTWYVGTAAGLTDWQGTVLCDFLAKGMYTATIYDDDGQGGIRKTKRPVKKGDLLAVTIKAAGGQAIMLEPEK